MCIYFKRVGDQSQIGLQCASHIPVLVDSGQRVTHFAERQLSDGEHRPTLSALDLHHVHRLQELSHHRHCRLG